MNRHRMFGSVWILAIAFANLSCAGGGGLGDGGGGGGGNGVGPLGCSLDSYLPNYCQEVDPSTGEKNELHWWRRFPLRIYFASNPTIQGQQLAPICMSGFNEWSDVSGRTLAVQTNSSSDAHVVVTFENLPSQPGSDGYVGQTSWSYNPSNLETFEADIQLRTWNGMTANQVANGLRHTAMHEFGHALFLAGHSRASADVMYPFGSTSSFSPLTARDENSILTAYCGSFSDRGPTRERGELARRTISCPSN